MTCVYFAPVAHCLLSIIITNSKASKLDLLAFRCGPMAFPISHSTIAPIGHIHRRRAMAYQMPSRLLCTTALRMIRPTWFWTAKPTRRHTNLLVLSFMAAVSSVGASKLLRSHSLGVSHLISIIRNGRPTIAKDQTRAVFTHSTARSSARDRVQRKSHTPFPAMYSLNN